MAQMELNLDGFISAQQQLKVDGLTLPGVVTIAGLSGVDGFSLTYDGRSPNFTEKDLELTIAAAMGTRFALRITPRADLLQLALNLPISQVTFAGDNIFEDFGADLETFVPQLKDAGKLISFCLEPELSLLKKAYRQQADMVELNVRHYSENISVAGQAEAQEQIALMAKTAEKNGLGVAVNGGISFQNVLPLVSIEAVENVVVGRAIIGRSIFVGLETAVRDFKAQVQ
ncbi:MAG: pyridoxine 5'-phosphate synthase [Candidatus Marinimicrobia bacterium]|nr:pyridoxine 5'-phosphate synthase [FCB group bacterium]MBL7025318.1 pyridoxine 5'-phosphate synthase [Candidatus Neomarinimicrobiota bacterium]